jgi:hypothetical protein
MVAAVGRLIETLIVVEQWGVTMEYRSKNNGWQTFFEHWELGVGIVVVFLTGQVLNFFTGLSGKSWIWCYGIGLAVAMFGALLIFYAKLPLYRQRRFLTFGSGALPENRRLFYRWGYGFVLCAAALLSGLFLAA